MRRLTATALAATTFLTLGAVPALAAAPRHPHPERSADRTQVSRDRSSAQHERSHAERMHRELESAHR